MLLSLHTIWEMIIPGCALGRVLKQRSELERLCLPLLWADYPRRISRYISIRVPNPTTVTSRFKDFSKMLLDPLGPWFVVCAHPD